MLSEKIKKMAQEFMGEEHLTQYDVKKLLSDSVGEHWYKYLREGTVSDYGYEGKTYYMKFKFPVTDIRAVNMLFPYTVTQEEVEKIKTDEKERQEHFKSLSDEFWKDFRSYSGPGQAFSKGHLGLKLVGNDIEANASVEHGMDI